MTFRCFPVKLQKLHVSFDLKPNQCNFCTNLRLFIVLDAKFAFQTCFFWKRVFKTLAAE